VQRRGELDAIGVEGDREIEPLLDRQIGIRVTSLARRELLERGGEHADRHELRLELLDLGHRDSLRCQISAIATGARCRADSIAAWSTRWVISASAKSRAAQPGRRHR
jgi:hypothetical protein